MKNKSVSLCLTKDIRESLKKTIFIELESLPQNLKKLSLTERLDYVTKLLPYVLPKVESVHHSENEPFSMDL